MSTSIRLSRLLVLAMLVAAFIASESKAATLDESLVDGWNAWRVGSDDSESMRCCYDWSIGKPSKKACDLDERRGVSIVSDGVQADTGEMQLYALIESGKVTKILTLSPQCPVTARSEINDHGLLPASDSMDWLKPLVASDDELSEDALASIGAHSGGVNALVEVVENRKLPMELREQALFWMAHSESDAAFDYIDRLLARH